MNINGIVTKEEMEQVSSAYMKTYKATTKFYLVGKIFWTVYSLLIIYLLYAAVVLKNGLPFLAALFGIPVVIDSLRNSFKNCNNLKKCTAFDSTGKALDYPREYSFTVDDEKVTVNDKITVGYSDIAMSAFYNEYIILAGSDKLPVVIKTDNDSQWQIFEMIKKLNKTCFVMPDINKKYNCDERIVEYLKTVSVKLNRKRKRKVLLISLALVAVGWMGLYAVGSMHNQSAKDINEYYYDENAKVYVTSQMSEKYTETKSYKALLDIYFDWAVKECKSVVAVNYDNGGVIIQMDLLFKDNDGTPHYIRYTDSEKALCKLIDYPDVNNWDKQVKNLSNYNLLKKNYPYIAEIFSLTGFDIEMVLKDNNLFTMRDHMYIFLTPAFYSCGTEKEDYYYLVSVSEKDIEEADKLLEYFDDLADKVNKTPYNDAEIDMEELRTVLQKHCKVTLAE